MKTWLSIIGIIGLVSAVAEAGITKSVTLQNGFTVNYATIEVLALDKDRDEAVIGVNVWKDQATSQDSNKQPVLKMNFETKMSTIFSGAELATIKNRVQTYLLTLPQFSGGVAD